MTLLFTGLSPARQEYTFSGYILDFPSIQQLQSGVAQILNTDRRQFLNTTRLRLRPALSLWTNAELSMEYEIAALYGSASANQLLQAGQNGRQVVNLTATFVNENHWHITHFIDRLQIRQGLEFADLTIGRQRIAWGTGRIWNPTDLFNPLNPAIVSKIEKDGVDAALAKVPFGAFTDLALVYNPQRNWGTSNGGFRFRTNYREFDLSAMGGFFDKRVVFGGDCAGNLFDAGVRGEGIISDESDNFKSNFVKFIIGADNQFTPKLYGMVEYQFNGEGKSGPNAYELRRLISGEILNLGRAYLAVSGSYLIHPLVTCTATLTSNLTDGSKFLVLLAAYSAADNTEISLGGQLFFAQNLDEYWYYPANLFLKAETYF